MRFFISSAAGSSSLCFPSWGRKQSSPSSGPGTFLAKAASRRLRRIATTRAIDECLITRIDKSTMITTIHKEPDFSELFMLYIPLSRNSRIEEDLVDQLLIPAKSASLGFSSSLQISASKENRSR